MKIKHSDKSTAAKPIFKKWWIWVGIVIILIAIGGNSGKNDPQQDQDPDINSATQQPTADQDSDFSFTVTDVPNDVTGNWRISTIAENIEIQNYALAYYKKYFKSDDEIHAIVNFNYNTATQISVLGDILDVSVYEYVDGEEHDAKLLFGGRLLKEYFVNKDTGEIEEIK